LVIELERPSVIIHQKLVRAASSASPSKGRPRRVVPSPCIVGGRGPQSNWDLGASEGNINQRRKRRYESWVYDFLFPSAWSHSEL